MVWQLSQVNEASQPASTPIQPFGAENIAVTDGVADETFLHGSICGSLLLNHYYKSFESSQPNWPSQPIGNGRGLIPKSKHGEFILGKTYGPAIHGLVGLAENYRSGAMKRN